MIINVSVSGSTFTASDRLPFANGQQIYVESRIPNQVPAPLLQTNTSGRVFYFIVNLSGNTFQVSDTVGGTPITLTDTGTGQITISEYPPLTWSQLVALPLLQISDIRNRYNTPESILNVSAASDDLIGATVAGNTIVAGIPHGLLNWNPVRLAGTLPSPLVAGTTYYARDITDDYTFSVASAIGGAQIVLTGGGAVTLQNYALDQAIAKKITIATQWLYDALLTKVSNHMKFVSRSWWWWFTPPTEPVDALFYPPLSRAGIVLDNLQNPEKLIDALIDYVVWAMISDATWRNMVKDPTFFEQFGTQPESMAKKRAEQRLSLQAGLLAVTGYQGASKIFTFDQTTDSVNISLV